MEQEPPARSLLDQLREQAASDRAARETAEAQLRRLLDVSLIGVCTCDLEGRVLEANDAFLRILGSSREELRSLSLDLIERTPLRLREMARRMRQLVVEKGELQPVAIELTRTDGPSAPVLISGGRLPNRSAVVIFAQDLTESRRKEAAVRSAEARLALVLEAAPAMLFQIEEDGAISVARNPVHPSLVGVGESLISRWPLQTELVALAQRRSTAKRCARGSNFPTIRWMRSCARSASGPMQR